MMQLITMRCDCSTHHVSAAVFGDWAAHPAFHEDGWCVTHVQHGRRLNAVLDEQQARAAAALLCDRVPTLRWREGQAAPHPDDVAEVAAVLAKVRRAGHSAGHSPDPGRLP